VERISKDGQYPVWEVIVLVMEFKCVRKKNWPQGRWELVVDGIFFIRPVLWSYLWDVGFAVLR